MLKIHKNAVASLLCAKFDQTQAISCSWHLPIIFVFVTSRIGYYRVSSCLCFKTNPGAKPLMKMIRTKINRRKNIFSYEWFSTKTRFGTKPN